MKATTMMVIIMEEEMMPMAKKITVRTESG
jgi:hypothetical protein